MKTRFCITIRKSKATRRNCLPNRRKKLLIEVVYKKKKMNKKALNKNVLFLQTKYYTVQKER